MNTNDETRDELALVRKRVDIAMGDATGIHSGQLHTPWQEVLDQTTEDIIDLVLADDLDAMLNKVSADATIEIFNDGDGFHVDLYYGDMVAMCTGATRREAVMGAVEKARKEQEGDKV